MSQTEALAKRLLDLHFRVFPHEDNVRPDWLMGLEADRLYRPATDVAFIVEVQGIQHDRPTPHFHKRPDDFQKQVTRDSQKETLAGKRGVTIYRLDIHDLTIERFQAFVRRILDDLATTARSRGDHHLLDTVQSIRYRMKSVQYPPDALQHAQRLQSFRVPVKTLPRPLGIRKWLQRLGLIAPQPRSRYKP